MAYKIYLSPSNQGANLYATGGTNEKHQCDKIAAAAATALKRCGFSVKVGRSGDTMANRCKESDAFNADIHLPIHTNAFNGKVTGGTLVMVYKNSTKHNKAGLALLKAVGETSPGNDYALRYVKNLYELSQPAALSLYLEVEFHDTKTGADWIRNNITVIGEAIAKGLCNYYGVKYKAAAKETTTAPATKTDTKKLYYVQTGAFSTKKRAEKQVKQLKEAGFDAIIK